MYLRLILRNAAILPQSRENDQARGSLKVHKTSRIVTQVIGTVEILGPLEFPQNTEAQGLFS